MRLVVAFAATTLAVALAKPLHGGSLRYEEEHPPHHDFLPPPEMMPTPGHPASPYSDAPHSAVADEHHAAGDGHRDQMQINQVLRTEGGHHKEEDLQKHSHPAKLKIPLSLPSPPLADNHGISKEQIADAHESHLPSGHLSKSKKGHLEEEFSSKEGHHKGKHHNKDAHDVIAKKLPQHADHHGAKLPLHHIAKHKEDHHKEALSKDGHHQMESSTNEHHPADKHHQKEVHDVITREHSASHDTHLAHLPFGHSSMFKDDHHEKELPLRKDRHEKDSLIMGRHHKEKQNQMRPHDVATRKDRDHATEAKEAHHEKVASPKEGHHKQPLQAHIYNITYNIYKHYHYKEKLGKEKKHEEQSKDATAKEIHPSVDAYGNQLPSFDHASKSKEDHLEKESSSTKGHHKVSSEKEHQKEKEEKMKEKEEKKDKDKEKMKEKEKEKDKEKKKEEKDKEKDKEKKKEEKDKEKDNHKEKVKEEKDKEKDKEKKKENKDKDRQKKEKEDKDKDKQKKEKEDKDKEKNKEKDNHKEKKEKEELKDKEKKNDNNEKNQKQKQSMDVTAEEIPASGNAYVAQLPFHDSKSKESHDKKEDHQKERKEDHHKDAASSSKESHQKEKDRQKHSHFTSPPYPPTNDSPSDVY